MPKPKENSEEKHVEDYSDSSSEDDEEVYDRPPAVREKQKLKEEQKVKSDLDMWKRKAVEEVEAYLLFEEEDWHTYHFDGSPPMTAEDSTTFKNTFRLLHADICKWWRKHEVMFPHVCVVARCWLATPPAQSIVERGFSCGKIVMSRLRTLLGDDLFEALVVLRMNRKLHNVYDLQKGAARLKRREKEGARNPRSKCPSIPPVTGLPR